MAGERRYTRIPPESTGDRVHMRHSIDINYRNKTSIIIREQTVIFPISGAVGIVSRIREDTATTGTISVSLDISSLDNNLKPELGENINDENGNKLAEVADNDSLDVYTNTTTVVGYNYQYNGLQIDRFGAANVRFSEGPASLDAFGNLRVSNSNIMGSYSFPQNLDTQRWTTNNTGNGAISHNYDGKNVLLTTSAIAGDEIKYTTNLYHHYLAGASQLTTMTVATGDAGKENLVREWGYFDDDNGAFFRLNGTTLQTVVREKTSGTVSEIVVDQQNWNHDRLDGSGLTATVNKSGFDIDVTKINIYWMDIQWLGGGRIRFGVVIDGQRITCHEYLHANRFSRASTQRGSLPVRVLQRNSGVVGSSSEMKFWCAGVASENMSHVRDYGIAASVNVSGTTNGNSSTFISALRPIQNLPNGEINHNLYFPYYMNIGAFDQTASAPGAVIIKVYQASVISGGAWDTGFLSTIEVNTTGTVAFQGLQLAEYYVIGTARLDLSDFFDSPILAIKNKADGTQQGFHVMAERVYGANDVNVRVSFGYKEITI